MLELYHNDMSVCAQKVRMVLAEKSAPWTGHHLNLRAGDQFAPQFLRINPKAQVPALVHDGKVITESNVICEYLDETFPAPSLMPDHPLARAAVRKWLIALDSHLHSDVAVISFAVAFRFQVLKANATPEALEAFLQKSPDPRRRERLREFVASGWDYPGVAHAVAAYEKALASMESALSESAWLVGDRPTLADFAYAPYIERLAQLQLTPWWADRPHVAGWLERVRQRESYHEGFVAWDNPHYRALMENEGRSAWPRIAGLLAGKA